MADKKPGAMKRRVRNPETFRERAIKAGAETNRPTRRSRAGRTIGWPFRLLGRGLHKLFSFRVLRPVVWVLRLIGKVIFPPYLRNSWRELRQVTWPNWQQSRQLTFAVLIFAVVFGAVVALVDYGLDKAFKEVLLK